jgi:hypothetical protein
LSQLLLRSATRAAAGTASARRAVAPQLHSLAGPPLQGAYRRRNVHQRPTAARFAAVQATVQRAQ